MIQRSSNYIMSTKHGMPAYLGEFWAEDGPPTDIGDRLWLSYPLLVTKQLHKRVLDQVKELDKELLSGLEKVGYKLSWGDDDAGFIIGAYQRGGGYYLDVGASRAVIDGKIKLKSGKGVTKFYENGVELEGGERIEADAVVLATGYGRAKDGLKHALTESSWNRLKDPWTLNEESESKAVWRGSGHERIYYMTGNLAMCRMHSKHLALQIKAIEEGLFDEGERYSFD